MEDIALKRLQKEKRDWKINRPFGFYAHLAKKDDGTQDYFKWDCCIPGPKGTPWEGGNFKIKLEFPQEYPLFPPRCIFEKKLFHPNIYPSGAVCLSIINQEEDWRAGLKVKDILLGIQELLKKPNEKSPAQKDAYDAYVNNRELYNKKVKQQALECKQLK